MTEVESMRLGQSIILGRVTARKVTPAHVHGLAREFLACGHARVWLVDMSAADTFDPRSIAEAKSALAPLMSEAGLETIVLVTRSSLIRMAAAAVRNFLHFRLVITEAYQDGVAAARRETAS